MHCRACDAANPDSHRFCQNCGTSLGYKCTGCGADCAAGAKFCGNCGVALGRPARIAPVGAVELVQPPMAAAPVAGWGELKQATVLFADIVSSTEQIATLDPEQAMERLQPAVMLMCTAVERFGGTVMRTLGDGVMALFGVPKALEGHATLACEAALHMQNSFAGNAQGLSIRVGLHSGLVASDPHAPDGGKGGGAHGMTIHLASRVVGVATPGCVALTGDCHSLLRGSVEVDSMGMRELKGVPAPVEIFSVSALKPQFTSHHFHRAKLTPLRGRDRELAALQHAQRLTEAGHSQVVGITGGPGTGKSRLCYEFAQWSRTRSVPVYEVRAQPYGNATPLQPVLELMRTFFFGINAADTPLAVRAKISQRLSDAGVAGAADEELLADFLGVSDGDGMASVLNAKTRRSRLLAIVAALVKSAAMIGAVVLIEDLHWLDEASEEFVATLVEAANGTRTMLVLNYRPSYRSPWAELDRFQQLELAELNSVDTDALVRELISHRREFQDISQLIVKRSGGNPFFAEELVRSLAERGVLSGDPNHSNNGLQSVESALPATVHAVIGARIDRLSEAEKSLLQMCAIVGKEIPLAILERIVGPLRKDLDRLLDLLCHAEMLQPQPAVGGRRFAFHHPLIQEVAYGSQLKAKRSSIHASVAAAMEHYYADQLDEFAALISLHYEAAGQSLNAAAYASRAARWLGATDSAQSIKLWQKVRTLLNEQPRNHESDRLRVMACGQIALLGWREGLSLEQVQVFIEEAMSMAGEVDSRLTQLLLMVEGRMLQASGGPADWYVERVQQALSLAQGGQDLGRKATLNAVLSHAYGWAGHLEQALAANDAAIRDVGNIDKYDQEFIGFSIEEWIYSIRIRLLVRLARLDEAQHYLNRVLAAGESTSDPVIRQIAHYGYVDLAYANNDVGLALEHAAHAAKVAEQHASPYIQLVAQYCDALAKYVTADYAEAVAGFSAALALVRGSNVAIEFEAELLSSLAECHLQLGDTAEALRVAGDALEVARQRNHRLLECRALVIAGVALASSQAPGSADEAVVFFDQAEALIAVTGAKVFEQALATGREKLKACA